VVAIEIAVGKVLAPVLGAVAKRGGKAAIDSTRMRRSGLTRGERKMLTLFNAAEMESSLNHLSFYSDLPDGISLNSVHKALESPEVQGAIKELMAATMAEAPAKLLNGIQAVFEHSFCNFVSPSNLEIAQPLATEIYSRLQQATQEVVNKLQSADLDTYKELRSSGQLFTMLSTLDSIDRHVKSIRSLSQNETLREECAQWEATYRNQAKQAYGYLEPPDFETKRKVKFEDLYVSPMFTRQNSDPFDRNVSLDALIDSIDRTVVLGDPGGGKSTVSRFIAYETAKEDAGGQIPYLVVLRKLPLAESAPESIVEHINSRLSTYYQCAAPAGCTESVLLSGRAIVIFDGLDELLDVSQRKDVTERVELFAARYPLARVLVTSRRIGYEQAQLDPSIFTRYGLAGFSDENVAVYAEKWFTLAEPEEHADSLRLAHSFVQESTAVPDLRRNPLVLALMCIIYRGEHFIPKNRPAVYEKCAGLLFEKWDSSRSIHVELRAAAYVDAALKHLAFWMMTSQSESEGFRESEIIEECSKFLGDHFENEPEAWKASREFIEFCRGRAWVFSDAGSTADGELLYTFTHRTFMEYFAAYHMTRMVDTPEDLGRMLLPRVTNQEWDMVAQLAVQIFEKSRLNGGQRVFAYFLGDGRRRSLIRQDNMLSFIARCMTFTPVSRDFAASVANRIVDLLRASATIACSGRRFSTDGRLASAVAILGVRDEVVITIQEVFSASIKELFSNGNTADELTARFLATEFVSLWRYLGVGSRAVATLPDSRWHEWAHAEFHRYRKKLLTSSPESLLYWQVAEELGYVSTEQFISWMKSSLDCNFPLDAAFAGSQFSIFSMAHHESLAETVMAALTWPNPEDQGLADSGGMSARVSALATALADADGPPYASFAGRDRSAVFFGIYFEVQIESVAPEYRWLATVLTLISFEWLEKRRDVVYDFPKDRFISKIFDLINARQSARKGGSAIEVDVASLGLDAGQEQLVAEWASGSCDFAEW
jgi:hypothetical protein